MLNFLDMSMDDLSTEKKKMMD